MNKKLVIVSSLLTLCCSFEINADKNGLKKEMDKTFSVRVDQVVDSVNEEMIDTLSAEVKEALRVKVGGDLAAKVQDSLKILQDITRGELEGKYLLGDVMKPANRFNAVEIAQKAVGRITVADIQNLADDQPPQPEQPQPGQPQPQVVQLDQITVQQFKVFLDSNDWNEVYSHLTDEKKALLAKVLNGNKEVDANVFFNGEANGVQKQQAAIGLLRETFAGENRDRPVPDNAKINNVLTDKRLQAAVRRITERQKAGRPAQ